MTIAVRGAGAALVMALVALCDFSAAHAHQGATGVVKERMMAMKNMGKVLKEWRAIRIGKRRFKADRAQAQARTLQADMRAIAKVFPPGSNKHPSEAKAAIWQNWQDFLGWAAKAERFAGELAGAAGEQKSTAIELFVKIGGTCGGCHKAYRAETD